MAKAKSSIEFSFEGGEGSIIKVVGVGGGGGNAVNNMFMNGISGVDFIICNTDRQVLDKSPVPNKVQMGFGATQGLGAGAKPEVGRQAALESIDEMQELLSNNTKMVFVTAGMGGGTGTGAAPVIAKLAKEMGVLTVGIVTTPFAFEGEWRSEIALEGIQELEKCVDTLLVIDNNNLLKICPKKITMKDAFFYADQVLCNAAKGIAEIITVSGYINVDFADVQTIMMNSGTALMGMATAMGEDRAIQAVDEALNSPLLDNVEIYGATGVLVNVSTSPDHTMTVEEMTVIGDRINEAVGPNARTIMGNVFTENIGEAMTITFIATGFSKKRVAPAPVQQKVEEKKQVIDAPVEPPAPVWKHERRQEPTTGVSFELKRPVEEDPMPAFHAPMEESTAPEYKPSLKNKQAPRPRKKPLLFNFISAEERLDRVRRLDVDINNPHTLKVYEDMPAYERRRESIEFEGYDPDQMKSHTSVDVGRDGSFQIKNNNSYLYDNVD